MLINKGKKPRWAEKYADKLKTKGNVVYYDGKEVVPQEEIHKKLNHILLSKQSDVPLSRDAGYHIIEQ